MSEVCDTPDEVKTPATLEEAYAHLHDLERATRCVSTQEELEALEGVCLVWYLKTESLFSRDYNVVEVDVISIA